MPGLRHCLRQLWAVWRTVVLVLTPVCLLPFILIYDSKEARCAYGLSIMAVYWITEALPLAATALLPVVIFPMLGLLPVSDIVKKYMKDTSMFGLGCLTFAIAVETSNLHKRVALRTLMVMGANPRWLMLGFMLPTWFLSMWVNNTSATAMMIPIVSAVLAQLKDTKVKRSPSLLASKAAQQAVNMKIGTSKTAERNKDARATSNRKKSGMRATHVKNDDDKITIEEEQELDTKLSPTTSAADYRRMCKGMSLCVAYAANIGGTGSLSGTSTNLIMQGQAQGLFQEYGLDSGVNFTTWMIFALPGSVICVILAWLWLTLLFFGPKEWIRRRQRDKVKDALVKETILREYQKLGPVSFAEKVVMGHFIVLVCLWLSRNPPMVPGWGSLFPPKFVGDSAAAILIALSLFVFPAECPQVFFWKRHAGGVKPRPVRSVLDWKTVQTNYPWGVLVLLGGGYALAHTCEVSGLSRWIGQELTVLAYLAPWQLSLALCAIIAMATEVTSNAATASLLLPILGQLAVNLNMNPLYLLFPCAISASFAFMLPVATPPNTIVFATGHLEVKDMVIAGSVLNVVCVLVVSLAANTWGMAYFKLDTLPPGFGAAVPNTTSMATTLGAGALYNYTTGGDSFISAFSNFSETPNAAYSVLNISGSL